MTRWISSLLLLPLLLLLSTATSTSDAATDSSNADPPSLLVTVFAPSDGDVVGVSGAGWVVDLSITDETGTNAVINAANGYHPGFSNPSNSTQFHPGSSATTPGLVVLFNDTPSVNGSLLQGPSTNLAGLFQINGYSLVDNGTTAQTWNTWDVLSDAFGQGTPINMTVYVVNGTAPDSVSSTPSNVISNVVNVEFTTSTSASSSPAAPAPPSTSAPAPPSTSAPAAAAVTTTAPAGASAKTVQASIVPNAIGMGPNAYSPDPININAGDTVVWTNDDSIVHTVTAASSSGSFTNNVYDSGALGAGSPFSHTFTSAGTFAYGCTIHGFTSMNGMVIVS